jgi:hypothetical protein
MDTEGCTNDLGIELVHILHKNTNMSYNACSDNIVEIFEYLSKRLPALEDLTETLVNSIKVSFLTFPVLRTILIRFVSGFLLNFKNTMENIYNPDAMNLIENLKSLSGLKSNLENGNTNFYDVQREIDVILTALAKISVSTFVKNVYGQVYCIIRFL